jgi:hypothetical protein
MLVPDRIAPMLDTQTCLRYKVSAPMKHRHGENTDTSALKLMIILENRIIERNQMRQCWTPDIPLI